MKILNKKRDGVPPGAVYVGRPSKFGNPFVIGLDGGREKVLRKYYDWFFHPENRALREAAVSELAGKDLVCWCAPERCHAELLRDYVKRVAWDENKGLRGGDRAL